MSTDISTDENPKKETKLRSPIEWDFGDNPEDFERKNGTRTHNLENELWYNTYRLGGGI